MARLLRLLALLLLVFPGLALAARTSAEAPELNAVASQISGQDLTVRCWTNGTDDPDADSDAWGYTYLFEPVVYLDPEVCAGALALTRGEMLPLWQLALGALTLTHESYHLKDTLPYWRRSSEAQTECRAIKRVRQTMLDLGASQQLADAILPWSIAEHFKIETLADGAYNYPTCKVPVFSDFWP
jgi:HAMP domain-containing protein